MASVVSRVGLLRLMLALVAGQAAGGLALDLVAPPVAHPVTAFTIVGVVLLIGAASISGRTRRPSR
jgi:uncharacterized membrane protein YdcZ (DUF606 family)